MNPSRIYDDEVLAEIVRAGRLEKKEALKLLNSKRKFVEEARRIHAHPKAVGGALARGTYFPGQDRD